MENKHLRPFQIKIPSTKAIKQIERQICPGRPHALTQALEAKGLTLI
jgi:hypothetical protein